MNNKDIHVDRGQISQRFGKMHQYLSLYFVNMLTMLLVSGTIQIARYGFRQTRFMLHWWKCMNDKKGYHFFN